VTLIVIFSLHFEISIHFVLSFSFIAASIFSRLAFGGTSTSMLHESLLMVYLNDA